MPVAAGEIKTFERLFHAHHHAVLGYALRRVGVAAAQDIAAETFLIAWRRRLDIPATAELPWLLGVTRNLTRQHHHAGSRDAALATELTRLQAFSQVGSGDPGREVGERLIVLQALADLSDADREVLILTAWDHLSNSDAAKVLGCSGATFRVRLHRARGRLEHALKDPDGIDQHAPGTLPKQPLTSLRAGPAAPLTPKSHQPRKEGPA